MLVSTINRLLRKVGTKKNQRRICHKEKPSPEIAKKRDAKILRNTRLGTIRHYESLQRLILSRPDPRTLVKKLAKKTLKSWEPWALFVLLSCLARTRLSELKSQGLDPAVWPGGACTKLSLDGS